MLRRALRTMLPGALPTFVAKFGGGLLIVAPVYTRRVAAALIPVLAGATSAHGANRCVFTGANGGWEYRAFRPLPLANRRRAHKLREQLATAGQDGLKSHRQRRKEKSHE